MIALLGLDFRSLEIGGLSDFLRDSEKLAAIDGIDIALLTTADYFYSIDTLFNMLLVFQAEEVVFDAAFMELIKECVLHNFTTGLKQSL